jgi:hypothetical protein
MKHARQEAPRIVVDPATDALATQEYAIRAIIDGLDQVAIEMERKWGVGRLRLLVNELLRAKFDAQKDKLDAAIAANSLQYIRRSGRRHEARLGSARQGGERSGASAAFR